MKIPSLPRLMGLLFFLFVPLFCLQPAWAQQADALALTPSLTPVAPVTLDVAVVVQAANVTDGEIVRTLHQFNALKPVRITSSTDEDFGVTIFTISHTADPKPAAPQQPTAEQANDQLVTIPEKGDPKRVKPSEMVIFAADDLLDFIIAGRDEKDPAATRMAVFLNAIKQSVPKETAPAPQNAVQAIPEEVAPAPQQAVQAIPEEVAPVPPVDRVVKDIIGALGNHVVSGDPHLGEKVRKAVGALTANQRFDALAQTNLSPETIGDSQAWYDTRLTVSRELAKSFEGKTLVSLIVDNPRGVGGATILLGYQYQTGEVSKISTTHLFIKEEVPLRVQGVRGLVLASGAMVKESHKTGKTFLGPSTILITDKNRMYKEDVDGKISLVQPRSIAEAVLLDQLSEGCYAMDHE